MLKKIKRKINDFNNNKIWKSLYKYGYLIEMNFIKNEHLYNISHYYSVNLLNLNRNNFMIVESLYEKLKSTYKSVINVYLNGNDLIFAIGLNREYYPIYKGIFSVISYLESIYKPSVLSKLIRAHMDIWDNSDSENLKPYDDVFCYYPNKYLGNLNNLYLDVTTFIEMNFVIDCKYKDLVCTCILNNKIAANSSIDERKLFINVLEYNDMHLLNIKYSFHDLDYISIDDFKSKIRSMLNINLQEVDFEDVGIVDFINTSIYFRLDLDRNMRILPTGLLSRLDELIDSLDFNNPYNLTIMGNENIFNKKGE